MMLSSGVLFYLPNGLLETLDVADFVDAKFFKIPPFQSEQLGTANIVSDEVVSVFVQLDGFKPAGYLFVSPLVDADLI